MGAILDFPSTLTDKGLLPSISNIVGMEGPYISASKTPTLQPILARVTARLAVTVDFPTPPLPEEIAIIESIPEMGLPLMDLT